MHWEPLQLIVATLHQCARLSADARGVIEQFQQLGGTFVNLRGAPEPDPLRWIGEDGSIHGDLRHHSLAVDVQTAYLRFKGEVPPDCPACGGFHCYPEGRAVSLSQTANVDNQLGVSPDVVALGLVNFLLFCNEHLGPRYGWVDEMGHTGPSEESIERGDLEYLFWANLFGPELAQAVGRDFLLGAPSGTVVALNNGGLLYTATDSFLEWRERAPEDVRSQFQHRRRRSGTEPTPGTAPTGLITYFRQKFPHLKRYRARLLPT